MPPKHKISKQQLIDVAFEIANTEGFHAITIRKIADKLGCSIAPIYVNFKDVEELKNEVMLKTIEITKELLAEQNSGEPFLDLGIASVIFAKRYPLLFEEFGLKQNKKFRDLNHNDTIALEQMKKDHKLQELTEKELEVLLFKAQAFQVGLSVLAQTKMFAEILTDEVIVQMLSETGEDIFEGLVRRRKS